jgi:hypothetical protein
MKRLSDQIVKTAEDRPCRDCANTFRACPMFMVLALSRVPEGMEVSVVACPEYRKLEDAAAEAVRAGKTVGGLIR